MIYLGSRYQDADIFYMLDGRSGKTNATAFRNRAQRRQPSRIVTKWPDGMRLDVLSFRSLGDPEKWWTILHENEEVLDPKSIAYGQAVRLP